MAFPLILIAMLLIISGVRNTTGALGQLVAKDFTGSKNFFYWIGALVIVGSIGYIPRAQSASRAFLVLIMVVMVISDKGFFAQFTQALSSVQKQAPSSEQDVGAAQQDPNVSQSSGGSVSAGSSAAPHAPGLFEFNPINDAQYLYNFIQQNSGAGQ